MHIENRNDISFFLTSKWQLNNGLNFIEHIMWLHTPIDALTHTHNSKKINKIDRLIINIRDLKKGLIQSN